MKQDEIQHIKLKSLYKTFGEQEYGHLDELLPLIRDKLPSWQFRIHSFLVNNSQYKKMSADEKRKWKNWFEDWYYDIIQVEIIRED